MTVTAVTSVISVPAATAVTAAAAFTAATSFQKCVRPFIDELQQNAFGGYHESR